MANVETAERFHLGEADFHRYITTIKWRVAGRLRAAAFSASEGAPLAVAASGGRAHPTIGLWSLALRGDLRQALVVEGRRKVASWTARHRPAVVTWPSAPFDPFFNVNTPQDVAEAERLAALDDE